MMTRSRTRPNLAERGEEEQESQRLETQRQQRIWDELPILDGARDDPFMSVGSDEEDERRLVDFFAPYTQVPLPATSIESENDEPTRSQRRDPAPPCSPNPSRCVSFACAATSVTPPPSADVSRLRTSRDENQAPEQESAHLAFRMQRPKLPASKMRGVAPRGRSLPMPDRRDVATSSRSASQERSMSKEEGYEIRVGLQNLSDMIMNVSHRLEKMKETQAPRPAKRANLTQQDEGRGDVAPPERHMRAPYFQQPLQAESRGSAFRIPARQRLSMRTTKPPLCCQV